MFIYVINQIVESHNTKTVDLILIFAHNFFWHSKACKFLHLSSHREGIFTFTIVYWLVQSQRPRSGSGRRFFSSKKRIDVFGLSSLPVYEPLMSLSTITWYAIVLSLPGFAILPSAEVPNHRAPHQYRSIDHLGPGPIERKKIIFLFTQDSVFFWNNHSLLFWKTGLSAIGS